MNGIRFLLFASFISLFAASCKEKQKANVLLYNAKIYAVNDSFETFESMAILDGKVVGLGTEKELRQQFQFDSVMNLNGQFVYPGFNDAHAHFLGYGRTLFEVDLVGAESMNQAVERAHRFFGDDYEGWIAGRGWDQNDWGNTSFPSKEILDSLFPDIPVALKRIDGHALWVNSHTLALAGINAESTFEGGEVMLNELGEPTGILIDNAMNPVVDIMPKPHEYKSELALMRAQDNCLAVGLTSLTDAGLPLKDVLLVKKMFDEGKLKIRINQMIDDEDTSITYFEKNGPIHSPWFRVASIKSYMDGALGSRGAWLLSPYSDRDSVSGLQLKEADAYNRLVDRANNMNFQLCTHAIGDAANRFVLEAYSRVLKKEMDHRWRVEHAQVLHPDDISGFGDYGILPSIQTTHATSDMYWAGLRLGTRISNAYVYQDLLKQNGLLLNGSDFPVESIKPLYGFYAAVSRADLKGFPKEGFQQGQALSRVEALRAMTIWPAYGSFEEDVKGSLEIGKYADLVVLDTDLLEAPIRDCAEAVVQYTIINGQVEYDAK